MAIQPTTGIPYIAYYSVEQGLKLATRTGNGNCGPANQWQCTAVFPADGTDSGRYPALAFRADGSYGLAYQKASAKTSFYYNGQTMESTPLVSGYLAGWGNGNYNAMTYDFDNNVHLFTMMDNGNIYEGVGLGYKSNDNASIFL